MYIIEKIGMVSLLLFIAMVTQLHSVLKSLGQCHARPVANDRGRLLFLHCVGEWCV